MTIAEAYVEISAKMDQLNTDLKLVESKIGKTAESSGKTFSSKFKSGLKDFGKILLGATAAISGIGIAAIKAASDSEETFSKFNTVFSGLRKESDDTAKALSSNFGLSSTKARELLGNTGDLLTGFGFTQDSALNLAKQVNELAVDLASFTNYSGGAEGASAALTKALLGEREGVKSLGISIVEEDVKKQVAINTSQGLIFETERQAKAYATLQLAQQQSKNATGDYARTSDSLANQMRLVEQNLNDLSVAFGSTLLAGSKGAVQGINELIVSLTSNTDIFEGLGSIVNSVTKIITELIPKIANLTENLSPLFTTIGDIASTLLDSLSPAFDIIIDIIGDLTPTITSLLSLLEPLGSILGTVLVPVLKQFSDTLNFVLPIFNALIEAVRPVIEILDIFFKVFEGNMSIQEGLNSIGKIITDFFKDLPEKVFKGGQSVIQSFVDGITSGFKWVQDGVTNIANLVGDFLGHSMPTKGPLVKIKRGGESVIESWADGLKSGIGLVDKVVKEIADSFMEFLSQASDLFSQIVNLSNTFAKNESAILEESYSQQTKIVEEGLKRQLSILKSDYDRELLLLEQKNESAKSKYNDYMSYLDENRLLELSMAEEKYGVLSEAEQAYQDFLVAKAEEAYAQMTADEKREYDLKEAAKQAEVERKQALENEKRAIEETARAEKQAAEEAELKRLEGVAKKEKEDKFRQEQEKLKIEEEAAEQEKALKDKLAREKAKIERNSAIASKVAGIFQVGVSTAEAVSKSWAASPLTLGLPWSGFAAAMGVAQAAAIIANPLPSYGEGAIVSKPTIAQIGEIPGESEAVIPMKNGKIPVQLLGSTKGSGSSMGFSGNIYATINFPNASLENMDQGTIERIFRSKFIPAMQDAISSGLLAKEIM